MNHIIMINMLRAFTGLGFISSLTSCSNSSYAPSNIPSVPMYTAASMSSLNKNSVSTAKRIVIKTGSMNLDVSHVRENSEKIEHIISAQGAHMLSYDDRDDKVKTASFSIRVPAQNLVSIMDQISELGKVTYRKVTVKDQTKEAIAQKSLLAKLKQRRSRLESIYNTTKDISDKLEIEETLAEIEQQIFSLEERARHINLFSQFSKLDISLSQKSIRGPIGATLDGAMWSLGKLITIRE